MNLAALENFRLALEKMCNDCLKANTPMLAEIQEIQIKLEEGQKFVRVVRCIFHKPTNSVISRSSHCFIDKSNGNILKAASWAAPDKKNPRGNINNANPLEGVTQYGVVYLR